MLGFSVNPDVVFHRDIRFDDNKTILESVLEKTFVADDGDQVISNVFLKKITIELNLVASILFETLYSKLPIENTISKLAEFCNVSSKQIETDAAAFLGSLESQNVLIKTC